MRCSHEWVPVPRAGFNLKQCKLCQKYQGAVYVPDRRLLTGTNRRELEGTLSDLKSQHKNGMLGLVSGQKHSPRLHTILDGYLKEALTVPGRKPHTLRSQIRCFKRELPNPTVHAMNTPGDSAYNTIGEWVKEYSERASPVSVRRKFNTLRAALNWGQRRGLIGEGNPCRRVRLPQVAEPRPRFLTAEEIVALFKASPREKFTRYCTLILHTGLRPNEALGLQIENIDFDHHMIQGFVQKNKRSLGSVPITKNAAQFLKRIIGKRTSGSLLEYTPTQLRKDALKAIASAKINDKVKPGTAPFTIYGLRHTFASHFLMKGESMTTVARWLRNSVTICDRYYGHLTNQYLKEKAEDLNIIPPAAQE